LDSSPKYSAIVIGASAGGLYALSTILEVLPADYPLAIIIVQHRAKDKKDLLEDVLQHKCKIGIKQADEKEKIEKATVYIAPPDYHLLIEHDLTFSLSADAHVNYSRPSIDVLFESAADVYADKLIGIILSGANSDGAAGILAIRAHKGLTIAQAPEEALFPVMPLAAIGTKGVTHVFTLAAIQNFLLNLNRDGKAK
jgi:two-component system chemotaxis response regulator CheB